MVTQSLRDVGIPLLGDTFLDQDLIACAEECLVTVAVVLAQCVLESHLHGLDFRHGGEVLVGELGGILEEFEPSCHQGLDMLVCHLGFGSFQFAFQGVSQSNSGIQFGFQTGDVLLIVHLDFVGLVVRLLLVLDAGKGDLAHRRFTDITDWLRPGDLMVVNTTRVFPARLLGRKESGGRAELFLLGYPRSPATGETSGPWQEALAPALGISPTDALESPHALCGTVDEICQDLLERRERHGIASIGLSLDALDSMAPVVAKLRDA